MLLNQDSAQLFRANGRRLAQELPSKDALQDFSNAESFEDFLSAIESLLANTRVFFDDEVLNTLNQDNWKGTKALLMIYAMNELNARSGSNQKAPLFSDHQTLDGASLEP